MEHVKGVLKTIILSGQLPSPPETNFKPLETVTTELPQLAIIPDGAPDCKRGQQLNNDGSGCEYCPVGYYQPNAGISCKDICTVDPNYCRHGGICEFDHYNKKPECTCRNSYKGYRCETMKDYAQYPYIIVSAGVTLFVSVVVIIVLYWVHNIRKRREGKQHRRDKATDESQVRQQHPSHRTANQQHANTGHGMSTTNIGATPRLPGVTTTPGIQQDLTTTPSSAGGVYETIPAQPGEIPSVYARVNQLTAATPQSVNYT